MPNYNDTTAYPPFSGATGKQELLRYIYSEIEPNCPNATDLLFRLTNTDLTALTDGATVYNPLNTYASA